MIGEARCKFRDANWHGIELRDPPPSGKAKQKLVNLAFIDLGKMPSAIHCLCLIGLKSWENLSPQDRDFWEDTVGSIKGLDCRSDLERCATINNDVLTDILIGIASKLKRKHKGKTTAAFNKLVAHEFLQCECPDDKFEAAFSNYAISALRNDYILIAIARDLKTEVAASLLEQRYRQHQAMHQVPKQRARFENWLPLISEFEDDQIGHRKAKSQVFVRYRRALDSIHFMSGGHGIHNARCRHILAVREFFLQEIFKAMAELSAEKKS